MKMPNVKYEVEKYIGIAVSYDPAVPKQYTFKTTAKDIRVGSLVVVPTNTRYGMTVCRVIKVGVTLDRDIEIKEIIREV